MFVPVITPMVDQAVASLPEPIQNEVDTALDAAATRLGADASTPPTAPDGSGVRIPPPGDLLFGNWGRTDPVMSRLP
ncbi:hypothetical protein [Nocardia puris]|uniref:hypothetical protein n=2 Tax=Nocardia puris TaxID=208602 RepID=UPI00389A9F62